MNFLGQKKSTIACPHNFKKNKVHKIQQSNNQ